MGMKVSEHLGSEHEKNVTRRHNVKPEMNNLLFIRLLFFILPAIVLLFLTTFAGLIETCDAVISYSCHELRYGRLRLGLQGFWFYSISVHLYDFPDFRGVQSIKIGKR